MNVRRWLVAGGVSLLVVACSSERSDTVSDAGGGGGDSGGASADCDGEELEATDTGITEDTIVVEVVADTGSQAIPGMANGSVEAVRAWADVVNEDGGLACRSIEVRTFDSKLDPNESRNGMVDACQNAFAMVGDFMLAAADATPIAECVDANGEETGLPEVPATVISPLVVCNPTTFFAAGNGTPCPPAQGQQTFKVATATGDYILDAVGAAQATGFYNIGYSSPQLLSTIMPTIEELRAQGLAGEVHGARGADPQTAYTAPVQQIGADQAQFVFNNATFPSFTLLQKEAQAQGVDVPLWICQSTCYDAAYPRAAGELATGVQVILSHVPFEEADDSEEMAVFTENVETRNTFSITSWLAARLFQTAVEDVVEADGPNGLTRASIIEALGNVEDFTANGLIGPTTPSDREPNPCIVVVTVADDGSFERTFPEEPGTLECGEIDEVTLDPIAAFSS